MLAKHRHLERLFCSADKEEELLGPGGVPTPTPEPGPTPTPQPDDDKKIAASEPLKPIAALLEPKAGEKKEEPAKEPPKADAASRINALTAEKWELKRATDAANARAKLAEDTI